MRKIATVLCVLAATGLFALDRTAVRKVWRSQPQTQSQQTATDFETYNGKQFAVVKVVDGDTLDIDIPDANYNHTRIRLWGVDTPETKDPRMAGPMYFGPEASEFATKLALGKQVGIYLDKDRNSRDKYHRLLAYVQLPDKTFLNEILLSEGYAYADLRFKHSFYNKYKQLESAARSQKKGLWAGVTPDKMPQWRQRRETFTAEHPSTTLRVNSEAAEVNN
jgi:micrococcal nuclease